MWQESGDLKPLFDAPFIIKEFSTWGHFCFSVFDVNMRNFIGMEYFKAVWYSLQDAVSWQLEQRAKGLLHPFGHFCGKTKTCSIFPEPK